jgi:hypothetical protein
MVPRKALECLLVVRLGRADCPHLYPLSQIKLQRWPATGGAVAAGGFEKPCLGRGRDVANAECAGAGSEARRSATPLALRCDDDLFVQFGDLLEHGFRHPKRHGQNMVWRSAQGHGDADIVAALLGAVVEHDQEAEVILSDILEIVKIALRHEHDYGRSRCGEAFGKLSPSRARRVEIAASFLAAPDLKGFIFTGCAPRLPEQYPPAGR